MTIDLYVYTPRVGGASVLTITRRLFELGMFCLVHPSFSFAEEDAGFLPILMQVHATEHSYYHGRSIATGFEIYTDEYDYYSMRDELGLGDLDEGEYVADLIIDQHLERYNQVVSIHFHPAPWEFRIAMYFAATLAELTGGVVDNDGVFLHGKSAVANFSAQVNDYEKSATTRDWHRLDTHNDALAWHKAKVDEEWKLIENPSPVVGINRAGGKPWWQVW